MNNAPQFTSLGDSTDESSHTGTPLSGYRDYMAASEDSLGRPAVRQLPGPQPIRVVSVDGFDFSETPGDGGQQANGRTIRETSPIRSIRGSIASKSPTRSSISAARSPDLSPSPTRSPALSRSPARSSRSPRSPTRERDPESRSEESNRVRTPSPTREEPVATPLRSPLRHVQQFLQMEEPSPPRTAHNRRLSSDSQLSTPKRRGSASPSRVLMSPGSALHPRSAGDGQRDVLEMPEAAHSPKRMVRSESEIEYFAANAQGLPSELADIVEYPQEMHAVDCSDVDLHHPVPRAANDASANNFYDEDAHANTSAHYVDDDPQNDPPMEEITAETQLQDMGISYGQIVYPENVGFHSADYPEQAVPPGSTYYPAPVPSQLRLPPLLSKQKTKTRSHLRRRSSGLLSIGAPDAWGASPLDSEQTTSRMDAHGNPMPAGTPRITGASSFGEEGYNQGDYFEETGSMILGSGSTGSDRATIMSDDDDYQNLATDAGGKIVPTTRKARAANRKTWLNSMYTAFTHKKGLKEDEPEDDGLGDDSDSEINRKEENDLAFTRYDPEVIEQHTKMFQSGGVYGDLRRLPLSGEPPSLIEEIEIRKAGRKIQRKVLTKESDTLESNRLSQGPFLHPVDQVHQPSLLELQQLANHDYKSRVEWHSSAINRRNNALHPDETLAQRRTRLKSGAFSTPAEPPQESLAARRARLRKSRPPPPQTISAGTAVPDEPLSAAHSELPNLSQQQQPVSQNTSPEFDMVRAVANVV